MLLKAAKARMMDGAVDAKLLRIRNRILSIIGGYSKYGKQVATCEALERKRVLIATSTGGHLAAAGMDGILASSLMRRGHEVKALLCNGILLGCQMCEPRLVEDVGLFTKEEGPRKKICPYCIRGGVGMYGDIGCQLVRYSELLGHCEREEAAEITARLSDDELAEYEYNEMKLGMQALAGARRFYAKGDIDDEVYRVEVIRQYLISAILTAKAMEKILEVYEFDVVIAHHGIYVPQGVIGEVCRKQGVRIVNWNQAYRDKTFIFSHKDTYHRTLMEESSGEWEMLEMTDKRLERIEKYLMARRKGKQDWVHFTKGTNDNKDIRTTLGITNDKPIISCFTNVAWDAQIHYPANAFTNMFEWLRYTLEHFSERNDVNLVIRIHPAEIYGAVPSRQKAIDEIRKWSNNRHTNIIVLGPESEVSSYRLAEESHASLIYGTKMGVELSTMGVPVIVAGEAWIRNKGLTIDVRDKEEYLDRLSRIQNIERLTADKVDRAKKYAYHFFFRRMIRIECIDRKRGWPPFKFNGKHEALDRGGDGGLDVIIDGILNGEPFIYDEIRG